MRAAIVASVVVLFAAALQADGEYIYTFHTPGKIHVYLNRPENPRTVTFELRTFPADAFVLAGSVRADNPYRGLVTAGTYRLEAAEAMTVMVGERTDEACPSLFVQPRPGRGSGAYLYTGSPVCTTSGRAFLYSPQAGARFVFAGADLL
ncbi:MAG: hypothetical protein JXA90_06935, partial [Planctomycetes bacterium]|nr:hypothetical protein [Planctomycetota bacterium]